MATYKSAYSGPQIDEAIGRVLSGSTDGASNRNLLDNGWFTVNQREVADATTISGNNYFADRWQATGNGVQRVAGGGISVLGTAYHKLDSPGIAGKTVTLSILYSDGEISSNTFEWTGTQFSKTFKYGKAFIYPSTNQINLQPQSVNVTAVKLELGSVSTLANDVAPNYAEELAKCQRYFYRFNGFVSAYTVPGSSVSAVTIPFPVTMIGVPAISNITYYDSKVAGGQGTYVSGARLYNSSNVGFSVTGFDVSADL